MGFKLEAGDGLLAYSAKDVGNKTKEADDTASFVTGGAFGTSGNPSINPSVVSSTTRTSAVPRESNHNAAYDSAQDEAYIFIGILEARRTGRGNTAAPADGESPPDGLSENQGFAAEGKESTVKTAKGTQVQIGFTVVEEGSLITSHDADGNANPDYPAELQPCDRSRDSSILT